MTDPRTAQLLEVIADYDAAADKFIAKVESGQARSRETYADLRACRLLSKAALRDTAVLGKDHESRSPDGDGPTAKAGDVKTEAGLQPPESGATDCTESRRETARAGSEPADSHHTTVAVASLPSGGLDVDLHDELCGEIEACANSLLDVVSVGRFAPAVDPVRFCNDLATVLFDTTTKLRAELARWRSGATPSGWQPPKGLK